MGALRLIFSTMNRPVILVSLLVIGANAAAIYFYLIRFAKITILSVSKKSNLISYSFNGVTHRYELDKTPMVPSGIRGFDLEILRPQPGTLNDYLQFNLNKQGKLVSTLHTVYLSQFKD